MGICEMKTTRSLTRGKEYVPFLPGHKPVGVTACKQQPLGGGGKTYLGYESIPREIKLATLDLHTPFVDSYELGLHPILEDVKTTFVVAGHIRRAEIKKQRINEPASTIEGIGTVI
ncbi:hypothetical protein ES703_07483 [subsurface metagenome]